MVLCSDQILDKGKILEESLQQCLDILAFYLLQ